MIRTGRVAQLAQRLGFDLTDALTGHVELLADFFQCVVRIHVDAETHSQYFRFAGGQAGEHFLGGFAQAFVDRRIHWRIHRGVLDEIPQMRVFIVADRRLHGDWLFGYLQDAAHLVLGHIHALAQFFRRRLTAFLMDHLPGDAVELVDRLDHMHRDADGAGLVCDGAGDGLTDPPGGVGRELVTATVFKLVHRLHQANVAFLNEVEELQATVGVFLGDRNHETQVGLDHLFLGAA